ncbi:protein FATTY ACID EXPORT 3, chloroplastic-like [Curcuma longa]|uniref:protein FATTY ACID EXPORT 3, chloroplastic-like n=1 Tax=Curcuma longa TaxID=136217 RepID=UPI003D9E9E82
MAAFPPGVLLLRNPSATLYTAWVAPRGLGLACPQLAKRVRLVPADRCPKKFVVLSASNEEPHLDIELENDDDDVNKNTRFSQEQWKEAFNRFKVEALKVKAVSEKAYAIYSKKIMEMLMDKAEKLKIQAGRAQKGLSILAQEISKEGQEYLSATEKNYPDLINEIMEAYASLDGTTTISSIREFYLGIPYGCFLSIGGFLYFMLTGSIPAIRFGVILGTVILALSVLSMRSWKNEKATPLLLVGQTAISAIVFFKQWQVHIGLFSSRLMLLISGAMLGFYVYRIASDFNKSEQLEQSS